MIWVFFNLFIIAMLLVDILIFHRKDHEVKIREALAWSAVWIVLALLFCAGIYQYWGQEKAMTFLTGYVLEKSLSVDNLFVFLLIFTYFKVPASLQHNVLFWGILGALIMRALFIFTGIALLERFHWIVYVFGGLLIFTGFKLFSGGERQVEPEKNPIVKAFRKIMPVTPHYHGNKFFAHVNHKLYATPLLVVLIVIETTDVIFAMDSIPAILAISTNSFIVYTSNAFAILGLRALYFALSGLMKMFHYLNYGLGVILIFVGVKMVGEDFFKIPVAVALGVIAVILAASIALSILRPEKPKH